MPIQKPTALARGLTAIVSVSWWVVAATLGLALCISAVSPFINLTNAQLSLPVSFSLSADALRAAAPALGDEFDGAAIDHAHGDLRYPVRRHRDLVGPLVMLVLMLGLALWVLTELRAVFRTVRDGWPFVAANTRRLRRVGYALVTAELARAALVYAWSRAAGPASAAGGLQFATLPSLNVAALIQALVILLVAEVFSSGTRLEEDQSLTV